MATTKPMLFNQEMVKALLSGRKNQTRRPVPKWQVPTETQAAEADGESFKWISIAQDHARLGFAVYGVTEAECMDMYNSGGYSSCCPFGSKGDLLWVRETHAFVNEPAYRRSTGVYQQVNPNDGYQACIYKENFDRARNFRWRPSIHMPRWASRITLEITDVCVERVKEITESDAKDEGCAVPLYVEDGAGNLVPPKGDTLATSFPTAKHWFSTVWSDVYGLDSWLQNDWVWVIKFKVHNMNVDQLIESRGK